MKRITAKGLRAKAALALALVMLGTGLNFYAPVAVATDEKQQQLENEKAQAQEKLDEINAQIEANKNNIANAQAQQSALQTQSNLISQQINILVDQIADTQAQISEKQDQVEQKQAEIDARWEDFKDRMAAMQEINDRGGIAILSQATNLYELLTFNQTLQDISEKDNEILAEMDAARKALEEEKAALEEQQARLEEQQSQLDSKKGELAQNIQQLDKDISAEEAEKEANEQAAAVARQKLNEAAEALDAYIRSQNNGYDDVIFNTSMGFISPLPSYKYVSCNYGDDGHKGVDWAALGGTPIYAAADGVVTISTYHYSYGNYVQVYHGADTDGNTFATLYAHMQSTPVVAVGQQVKQGQLLGYVGSTGNSTGNHLHLELRVNGNRTNPMNYIPKPSVVKYS